MEVSVEGRRPTRASGGDRRDGLNVREAAGYLGLSPATLYMWRHRRQGLPSFRMGRSGRVMYRIETLDEWIREQEQAGARIRISLRMSNAMRWSVPVAVSGMAGRRCLGHGGFAVGCVG
ncbi:helix-turn-helix domain-containing protein [Streptomyces sp. NPDC048255]|uniref:helix-turn-helix transcriptional regulator n=1 Tax=Streptomyces sp. NPDC048255 TaxID=3154713 RepID=UPI0033E9ED0D